VKTFIKILKEWSGVVIQACNPSYSGGTGRKIMVVEWPQANLKQKAVGE
jgi:hypothetical protein